MIRAYFSMLLFTAAAATNSQDLNRALMLYQSTEYHGSLQILESFPEKNASVLCLIGRNYLMLRDYKKAIAALAAANRIEPENAECVDWLGRAYGGQAETGNLLAAPGYATKARQMFEMAFELDPSNKRILRDLFTFYLRAPEVLGGGIKKAESSAARISLMDPAEGQSAEAQIEEVRKDYNSAEHHLRVAWKLDSENPKRAMDLAILLGKAKRFAESDSLFDLALTLKPYCPEVAFQRASVYVSQQRNMEQAKRLLQDYLRGPLTPEDPPREEAEALLKKISVCCR